jgi:hypothetical protein
MIFVDIVIFVAPVLILFIPVFWLDLVESVINRDWKQSRVKERIQNSGADVLYQHLRCTSM